jgi:hypothetical protein
MINIITAVDPTTAFLNGIVASLRKNRVDHQVIEIYPDESSYKESLQQVKMLKKRSTILFLGHGSDDGIYGGESSTFKKQAFVKLNQMGIFREQMICLLACNSASLLKSSFKMHRVLKCVGFGALPTSMEEVAGDHKLANLGISNACIEKFKDSIVKSISTSLVLMDRNGEHDFIYFKDHLGLILSHMINKSILEEKDDALAELLFKMKLEMALY